LLIGITSCLWVGISILWGIRMRSWRLAVVPTLALSLAVMIGVIAQYTPTKDAYYLLGLLASGYTSFAIAKRLKHEAIRRMELE